MKKALWEYSLEELEKEIETTQKILQANGYNKLVVDRLSALEEQREERLIEADIMKGSRYAQDVLQVSQGVVDETDKN